MRSWYKYLGIFKKETSKSTNIDELATLGRKMYASECDNEEKKTKKIKGISTSRCIKTISKKLKGCLFNYLTEPERTIENVTVGKNQ